MGMNTESNRKLDKLKVNHFILGSSTEVAPSCLTPWGSHLSQTTREHCQKSIYFKVQNVCDPTGSQAFSLKSRTHLPKDPVTCLRIPFQMIDMGDATFFRVGMPVSRSMALHYGLNSGALL